jgi:hypothetical protein
MQEAILCLARLLLLGVVTGLGMEWVVVLAVLVVVAVVAVVANSPLEVQETHHQLPPLKASTAVI